MEQLQDLQLKIGQLQKELAAKNEELNRAHNEYGARFQVIESKLAAVCQNELNTGAVADANMMNMRCAASKTLVNKPEVFKGEPKDSLDSFTCHMDLYTAQVPEESKLAVAVSFLGGHAFDWFKVINQAEPITSWSKLKEQLSERFRPIDKIKTARDKLAAWKQVTSVSQYNETYLKIIIDIPNISADETIDRYMRGLKQHVSRELCTTNYTSLTTLMSHALRVESSKLSFSKSMYQRVDRPDPVPMDISNARMKFTKQKKIDYESGACFKCHKQGCRWESCPLRKNINCLELENQGKDSSQ